MREAFANCKESSSSGHIIRGHKSKGVGARLVRAKCNTATETVEVMEALVTWNLWSNCQKSSLLRLCIRCHSREAMEKSNSKQWAIKADSRPVTTILHCNV